MGWRACGGRPTPCACRRRLRRGPRHHLPAAGAHRHRRTRGRLLGEVRHRTGAPAPAHRQGLRTGTRQFHRLLPQPNRQHATWPEFFVHERLEPQLKLARDRRRVGPAWPSVSNASSTSWTASSPPSHPRCCAATCGQTSSATPKADPCSWTRRALRPPRNGPGHDPAVRRFRCGAVPRLPRRAPAGTTLGGTRGPVQPVPAAVA